MSLPHSVLSTTEVAGPAAAAAAAAGAAGQAETAAGPAHPGPASQVCQTEPDHHHQASVAYYSTDGRHSAATRLATLCIASRSHALCAKPTLTASSLAHK